MVCPAIATEGDKSFSLSNYNVTSGVTVTVGCKQFGRRVVGAKQITCNGTQWEPEVPKCEWTGVLNTSEILTISFGAAGVFVIIAIIIIILVCALCRRKENSLDKRKHPSTHAHNGGRGHYPHNTDSYISGYDTQADDLPIIPPNATRGSGAYKSRISNYNSSHREPYRNGHVPDQQYSNEAYDSGPYNTGYIQNNDVDGRFHIPRPKIGPPSDTGHM